MQNNHEPMSYRVATHITVQVLSMMLAACPALAQDAQRYEGLTPVDKGDAEAPVAVNSMVAGVKPRGNAVVGEVKVEVARDNLPADGQTATDVNITLYDLRGMPLQSTAVITIEATGGARVLLPNAATDELGPEKKDANRVTPGTQVKVEKGVVRVSLLAPTVPQDVTLRVTAGAAMARGQISYLPELRPMVAVGVVDAVVGKRRESSVSAAPQRFNDAFEQDIQRWSRQFNDGKTAAAARAAFFVKGTISGQNLLTAAYDSDKETRSQLQRDINPEAFYPVYGDSAMTGFDARSSQRFYVRIDNKKSYILYGDFTTDNTSAIGLDQRQLGRYSRSATGARGHYESGNVASDAFAIYDTLKQVIEEYATNGTSGPFAVRNNTAIENSEKVELLVRDKNQMGIIKRVTPLVRFEDYSFEPFSGRLLFKQAMPSLTPDGDPQSIRITYEVDQGGEKFWAGGASGEVKLGESFSLGASAVKDKNPQSPYDLESVNAGVKLGANTSLVVEAARSTSTTYTVPGTTPGSSTVYATPSGLPGEMSDELRGNAMRAELKHKDANWSGRAYWNQSDKNFNNTAAGITAGQGEMGVQADTKVTDRVNLFGEAIRSENRTTDGQRDAQRAGVRVKVTDGFNVEASVQHINENGGMPATAGIAANTAPLGGGLSQTGGFFGGGAGNAGIDPNTGQPINTFAPVNSTVGVTHGASLHATTARLGTNWKATDRLTLQADVEKGFNTDVVQTRYGAGALYQLSERTRAYGRYENQTGLASAYSLNPADRSNSFVGGVETSYLPNASIFSEYRMRDALSTGYADQRDMQLATGLRNTWNISEGIAANTNMEVLQVLSGMQQKGVAVAGGLDYAVNPLWRGSGKLEFRRLFDNVMIEGNQTQDQWLSTLSFARKLDRDWTLLARNYLLYSKNHNDPNIMLAGNAWQDRAQIGFAWRPVDVNKVNTLMRYEYKRVKEDVESAGVGDLGQTLSDNYSAHIVSLHGDYHPSRPWWLNGRLAVKSSDDHTLPDGQQKYVAWLMGSRAVYDVTEKWDIGLLAALMYSPQSRAIQWANGLEAGYQIAQNLWFSAGFNWMGFSDRELSGADYTARGPYVRLRFKFDETLFKGNDPEVNRSLPRILAN